MRRFTLSQIEVRWIQRLIVALLAWFAVSSALEGDWLMMTGNVVFLLLALRPWKAR